MTDDRLQSILRSLRSEKLEASTLSDEDSLCVVSAYVSTGCVVLDAIMGGGLPVGRIVEIYGDTSTGKSLIAAQACATMQERGGIAVYIDTESAVSLPIIEAVGVDPDTLVYLAPDTVEDVFAAMEAVLGNEDITANEVLLVWDSVAATSSAAEMGKDTGETGYLTQARIISQGLRKLSRAISKRKVAVLFLNQVRTNIGVLFGDKVATFGGKAIGFHSSVRVQLRVSKKILDSDKRVIGVLVSAEVVKNKVAPPFRKADLPIYFGHGIDDIEATYLYLVDSGVISHTGGGWYEVASIEKDGKPLKFRASEWEGICEEFYPQLCDLIGTALAESDLI